MKEAAPHIWYGSLQTKPPNVGVMEKCRSYGRVIKWLIIAWSMVRLHPGPLMKDILTVALVRMSN